ncbi:MAG: hypothetical protein U1E73_02795 [Planctomycetota bacterium]
MNSTRILTGPLALAAVLSAQNTGQAPQRGPMLLPEAVVLPRGDRELAIDGSLNDWPELPAMRLDDPRQLSGTALKAWNGPSDASAIAFALWDATDFYFAAVVKDEWHRALDANSLQLSEVPMADCIVLTFDPDRDTRSNGPDPGRTEDRSFWFADEPSRDVVMWDRLRGTAVVLPEGSARMVVLHDKEQGLTTYEAKIPWREILPVGRVAAAGLVTDLQIIVNDFDEATDPMPQTRIGWTFGCGATVDPGLFGTIMLVDDAEALRGHMPQFPPKPSVSASPLGTEEQWHDLTARLLQSPPAVHDGSAAPEEAGGLKRMAVLEEIDGHCARYPRVDNIEYFQHMHRRMAREVAGIRARGLPFWMASRLQALSKRAEDPIAKGSARLFRLPMGGWLVGTQSGGFTVDAAGADVAEYVWGRAEMCVCTQPLDMTRRNDQFLLRMLLSKPPRPVLTHIAFHLPVVAMADMPLVEPGTSLGPPHGLAIKALGSKMPDGAVRGSCSYRIEVPDGPRLLFVGPALTPELIGEEPVDAMVLSPINPQLREIVAKARPALVILDDGFLCDVLPNFQRVSLRDLYAIQKALQPQPSLLLAPGEDWEIVRGK